MIDKENVKRWEKDSEIVLDIVKKNNNSIMLDDDMKEVIRILFHFAKSADDSWLDLVEEDSAAIFLAMAAGVNLDNWNFADVKEYIARRIEE